MARPKPTIILEHINKSDYRSTQILGSDGIWSVFYDNEPINLKASNSLVGYPSPKYKKVSFSNPGHAIHLAKKLNKLFKTDKFTVVLLNQGTKVYPDDGENETPTNT